MPVAVLGNSSGILCGHRPTVSQQAQFFFPPCTDGRYTVLELKCIETGIYCMYMCVCVYVRTKQPEEYYVLDKNACVTVN